MAFVASDPASFAGNGQTARRAATAASHAAWSSPQLGASRGRQGKLPAKLACVRALVGVRAWACSHVAVVRAGGEVTNAIAYASASHSKWYLAVILVELGYLVET